MINREKANVLIEEYVRDRNKAVLSLDVRTFKDFVIRWTKKGALPSCFILADDNVIEIALRQMVLGIADAPKDKIEEARAWLKARGYSTEPWKKEKGYKEGYKEGYKQAILDGKTNYVREVDNETL